jgi:hypothetical protein
MAGDKSVIVPWTEKVYYGRQQNGYHGGATPQEMVCPLILLTTRPVPTTGCIGANTPNPIGGRRHLWLRWNRRTARHDHRAAKGWTSDAVRHGRPERKNKLQKGEEGETGKHSASGADWIAALLKSQAYKDQKAMIRRHPVENA